MKTQAAGQAQGISPKHSKKARQRRNIGKKGAAGYHDDFKIDSGQQEGNRKPKAPQEEAKH